MCLAQAQGLERGKALMEGIPEVKQLDTSIERMVIQGYFESEPTDRSTGVIVTDYVHKRLCQHMTSDWGRSTIRYADAQAAEVRSELNGSNLEFVDVSEALLASFEQGFVLAGTSWLKDAAIISYDGYQRLDSIIDGEQVTVQPDVDFTNANIKLLFKRDWLHGYYVDFSDFASVTTLDLAEDGALLRTRTEVFRIEPGGVFVPTSTIEREMLVSDQKLEDTLFDLESTAACQP